MLKCFCVKFFSVRHCFKGQPIRLIPIRANQLNMRKKNPSFLLIWFYVLLYSNAFGQNIGINTMSPLGALHVKGAEDISQLIIDADTIQGNNNPLIRLRSGMGSDLLWIHSDDSTNVFIGLKAGKDNIISNLGIKNTFIGSRAGISNIDGISNTAIGFDALHTNIHGSNNTAVGIESLFFNGTGNGNTANGRQSLYSNEYGIYNTASGEKALYLNQSGNYNCAFGFLSLYANKSSYNTACGYAALQSNNLGDENSAFGASSLHSNINGGSNTAIGTGALSANTGGNWNTAIGFNSLSYETFGQYNIAMGSSSGSAQGSPNVNNTISIGNHGYLNAASNQAFLGNGATLWNGGNVTWSTYSDARVKTDVHDDVKGLDFITRLRPVTYHRNIEAMVSITGNDEVEDYPEKYDIEKIKFSGFLAQDVEVAAKEANYDFSGITIPNKSNELYTLSYEQFVVPLVKAVQEQQAIIEALQQQVESMQTEKLTQAAEQFQSAIQQKQIDELLKRIEVLEKK